MGDVVHALPVAADIKRVFPNARIDWVVEESFRDIPLLSEHVDDIVVTAFRRWRKNLLRSATRKEIGAVKNRLGAANYDAVIDLQGLLRSAVVCRWTHAESFGYSREIIRERAATFFYRHCVSLPAALYPVQRYRMMVARVLGYKIESLPLCFGTRSDLSAPLSVSAPYAALAVNTSRPEKLWPQQRWIEFATCLSEAGLTSVLFWGNATEKSRVEEIAAVVPGAVVAPKMTLRECAGVLKHATLAVGVDTGLAHLGAALGVPSVGIIVGTSAALFSLISEKKAVTVGDKGIVPSVDDVYRAAQVVLSE